MFYEPNTYVPRKHLTEKIAHRVVRRHIARYTALAKYQIEMLMFEGIPILVLTAGGVIALKYFMSTA